MKQGQTRTAVATLAALLLLIATVATPVVSVAAVLTLDQAWEEPNFSGPSSNQTDRYYAQTFTAGLSGPLERVDAKIWPSVPSSTLVVQIRSVDVNGVPTSTVLAEETIARPWLNDWESFTFSTPATVTAGTSYALVLLPSGTFKWSGTYGNPYAAGASFWGVGAPTTSLGDIDLGFRTYVSVQDVTAPVVTPVLDPATPNGADGWYTTPLTVSWDVSDPESGIASSSGCGIVTVTSTTSSITITCTATNGDGLPASESVTVKVDQTAPILDLSLDRAADRNGWYNAPVGYGGSFTDLESGTVPASCGDSVPAEDPYVGPDGANVSWTISCTNYAGLVGSQTLTFNFDDTNPTITAGDVTVEATGPNGASATFSPVTDDTSSGVESVACVDGTSATVVSGGVFPLGATDVTCTVTDLAGNTASDTFTITVQDTTAPVVGAVGNVTVSATGPSGATVAYSVPTVTDAVTSGLVATCTPPSGSTFPIGTTTVTCSATDAASMTGSSTFTVTVQDTTAPVVTVPGPLTVNATGPNGAPVPFQVSASDVESGPLVPVCVDQANRTFVSGSTFPAGASTVTCTAVDGAGNSASASFSVTVVGAADLLAQLRADTIDLVTNSSAERALVATIDQARSAASAGNSWGVYTALLKYTVQLDRYADNGSVSQAACQQLLTTAHLVFNAVL